MLKALPERFGTRKIMRSMGVRVALNSEESEWSRVLWLEDIRANLSGLKAVYDNLEELMLIKSISFAKRCSISIV